MTGIIDNGVLDRSVNLLSMPGPTLQIPVVVATEYHPSAGVSDIKRLSDGAIVVAHGGGRELQIYEADGSHRVTVSGAEEGRAAFRYPAVLLILPEDNIQVQDFPHRLRFAPDGAFLARETADKEAFAALYENAGGRSEGGRWMSDGSFFAPIYERQETPPRPGPAYRPPITLVRMSANLSGFDVLGDFAGVHQQVFDVGGSAGIMSIILPFPHNTSWALGSADGTIVAGDSASPQIDRFHPDGAHSIVRWTAEARALKDEDLEAWKRRYLQNDWAPARLPELERAWAAMDIPETKALFGQVVAGSDGSLWVGSADYGADTTSLLGFDPEGRFAGTVELPGRFVPHDSGPGWLLGVFWDESDAAYIHMYELRAR